jgi:hypothetical protein
MVLRKLRWLPAAVLAAAAAVLTPARSSAGIIIQVQEVGGSYNQTFNAGNPLPASFDTGNFTNVKITVNSTSTSPANQHSISTTLNAAPASSFNSSIGLQVTVLDNGFVNTNVGGDGGFTGNVSNTSAFAPNSTATGSANLSNPNTNLGPATATPGGSGGGFSPANISGLPDQFSIQQVLTLQAGSVGTNATFTAGISTQVDASPVAAVPAPPALVLALAAVPALGLRRLMRKKA